MMNLVNKRAPLAALITLSIPLQLSPVAILNNVSMLLPNSLKLACFPSPSQGVSAVHSE